MNLDIPSFLSSAVRMVLIMSISGGGVVLLLLGLRPLVRHRLPKAAQYYFWCVALFALLVPLSQFLVLPAQAEPVWPVLPVVDMVQRNVMTVAEAERSGGAWHPIGVANDPLPQAAHPVGGGQPLTNPQGEGLPPQAAPSLALQGMTVLILFYPVVALLILAYHVIGYALFAHKLKKSYQAPYQEELALLQTLAEGRVPKLYISHHAPTPMLMGYFSPVIVLPDRDYAPQQLESILLHELTHMRRHDIAVKWLTLLACAVHWFNPLVWVAKREINRSCELSCDAAVVANMDGSGKKHYGHTLIDVATNGNIPLPIISTTMCQEKRALKERLTAIMKNRKHTKLAALVSVLIILTALLGACGIGASRSTEAPPEATTQEATQQGTTTQEAATLANPAVEPTSPAMTAPDPVTRQDFAARHIQTVAEGLLRAHITLVDQRIHTFEQVAAFDHLTDYTIELWRLDFAVQVTHEPFVRWGVFEPDQDGWISTATSFNDGNVLLMFNESDGVLHYLGYLPSSWVTHAGETVEDFEDILREFLISQGELPRVDYPGNHYFVYIWNGEVGVWGHTMRLLLSQPIRQGEGGIWAVDSIYHLHDVETTPVRGHLGLSRAGALAYFAQEQALHDSGQETRLLTPEGAAAYFMRSSPGSNIEVLIMEVYPVPPDTPDPTQIPRRHGPELVSLPPSFALTTQPRFFTPDWDGGYHHLRQTILDDIGGLAFNQAYQVQMEDGRFAMVTGWRPLLTREALNHYTGLDVPSQVGDFTLVGVTVSESMGPGDSIAVYNHVMPRNLAMAAMFGGVDEGIPAPVHEVFEREFIIFSFYAVYVNSAGRYIAMGVQRPLFGGDPHERFAPSPITLANLGPSLDVVLIGENDRYIVAHHFYGNLAGEGLRTIEFAFVDPETLGTNYWGWGNMFDFVGLQLATAEELLDVVTLFDIMSLYQTYLLDVLVVPGNE